MTWGVDSKGMEFIGLSLAHFINRAFHCGIKKCIFLIVAVHSDVPVGGKFKVQFPLPGLVGFTLPSQPESALTGSEAVKSRLKELSTAEVNRTGRCCPGET